MAMGLQKSSGADFLPSFRFNAVSGLAVIAGSTKANDGVSYEKFENDVVFPAKFIFDFSDGLKKSKAGKSKKNYKRLKLKRSEKFR